MEADAIPSVWVAAAGEGEGNRLIQPYYVRGGVESMPTVCMQGVGGWSHTPCFLSNRYLVFVLKSTHFVLHLNLRLF